MKKTHSQRTIEFYNEMVINEDRQNIKQKQIYIGFCFILLLLLCFLIYQNKQL